MNRRLFLRSAAAIAATAVLDPDELIWKPGKLISIPKPRVEIPSDMEFCAWLARYGNIQLLQTQRLIIKHVIDNGGARMALLSTRRMGATTLQANCIRAWKEAHA